MRTICLYLLGFKLILSLIFLDAENCRDIFAEPQEPKSEADFQVSHLLILDIKSMGIHYFE